LTDTDADRILKLRALAHDLSNSLETVTQAGYLLAQAQLDDTSRKWVSMINVAVRDAARLNVEIREILRTQSADSPAPPPPPAAPKVSRSRSSSGKNRRRDT
jgi:hypothetical protein